MKPVGPSLTALVQVVEKLQGRMEEHGKSLFKSESLTRYLLIDPFLRALGWDTEDPKSVWVDYGVGKARKKRVDYALFRKDGVVALVEAEHWGACSNRDALQNIALQLINYCNLRGTSLGILTDGGCWLVYDIHRPAPFEKKLVLEIDFASDAVKVEQASMKLSPPQLGSLAENRR